MPSEDAELNVLLQRMSPGIADLMLRMMSKEELTWEKARAFRDEIVELNKTARTDEEQMALVFSFNSLMNEVEEFDLVDPSSLDHFRNVLLRPVFFFWLVVAVQLAVRGIDEFVIGERAVIDVAVLTYGLDYQRYSRVVILLLNKA